METNVSTLETVTVAPAICRVNAKKLTAAIMSIKPALSKRATLPVLQNILLEAKENTLTLASTNLEMYIQTIMPAITENNFSITIPVDPLLTAAKYGGDVTLTFKEDKPDSLLVNGMVIRGIDAQEFPPFPALPETWQPIPNLAEAIQHVAYAASKDAARPALQGVRFESGQAIVTDGFRVVIHPVDYTGTPLLIPAIPLSKMAKLLGKDTRIATKFNCHTEDIKELVTMCHYDADDNFIPNEYKVTGQQEVVDSGMVFLHSSNIVMAVNLITDFRFPDISAVLPKQYEYECIFDARTMQRAVEQAEQIAKQEINKIKLTSNGNEILVSSQAQDYGEITLPVPFTGSMPQYICFNYRFLVDYLQTVEGEIVMKSNAKDRPALFTDGITSCLIMPMYLE